METALGLVQRCANPRFGDESQTLAASLIASGRAISRSTQTRVHLCRREVCGQPSAVLMPSIRSRAGSLVWPRRSEEGSSARVHPWLRWVLLLLTPGDSETRSRDCPPPLCGTAQSIECRHSDEPRQLQFFSPGAIEREQCPAQ